MGDFGLIIFLTFFGDEDNITKQLILDMSLFESGVEPILFIDLKLNVDVTVDALFTGDGTLVKQQGLGIFRVSFFLTFFGGKDDIENELILDMFLFE